MNKKTPLVSVVILTWNRFKDLRETLVKLRLNYYSPLEIIVVDNGSTDGTDKMVSSEFPDAIYLKQDKNRGIAGYNVGFAAAKGEYVVALDSDSYPARDAFTKMKEIFDEYPNAGAVAFDVLVPSEKSEKMEIPVNGAGDGVHEVTGYHGAGVGFRKEVFSKVGYWYEPFFLYFNEMDHALRMLENGYSILRSPAVRAFHKTTAAARPSERSSYFYARNALWLIWRRYPFWPMLKSTLYFIYLATAESFYQRTFVFIKALRDAFMKSGKVLSERKPLKSGLFDKIRIPLPLVFSRRG